MLLYVIFQISGQMKYWKGFLRVLIHGPKKKDVRWQLEVILQRLGQIADRLLLVMSATEAITTLLPHYRRRCFTQLHIAFDHRSISPNPAIEIHIYFRS